MKCYFKFHMGLRVEKNNSQWSNLENDLNDHSHYYLIRQTTRVGDGGGSDLPQHLQHIDKQSKIKKKKNNNSDDL